MANTTESQPLSDAEQSLSLGSIYFDTLPIEIFSTIIKHVFMGLEKSGTQCEESDTTKKKREPIVTLSMLFSRNGPFSDALPTLFTDIHLGCKCDVEDDHPAFVIRQEIFDSEGLESGLPERIFQLCGESVKTISIFIFDSTKTNENLVFQHFASLVGMYCSNVENLRLMSYATNNDPQLQFEDFVPGLLMPFSSQLRLIDWDMNSAAGNHRYVPNITMCRGVQDLTFPASPELVSFLISSGSSLQSLTVLFDCFDETTQLIDAIELNCRNLSKICILSSQDVISIIGEERYAHFLCSFGSSLTCASIQGLSMGKLAQVLRACPNLLVDTYALIDNKVDEWEHIRELGSMIEHLTVDADMWGDKRCEDAVVKCTNLKELTISRPSGIVQGIIDGSELNIISSLSSSSLTDFQHLCFEPTERNVAMLASAALNLRKLSLCLAEPIEIGVNFRVVADSNPSLDTIEVIEPEDRVTDRDKGSTLEVLGMLVKTFSKCRSIFLSLLVVHESLTRNEIHDICGYLPCRGVDLEVYVGSICYQQLK